jgi:transposase
LFDHTDELRQQLEQLQRENAELQARIAHLESVNAEQQVTLEQLQELNEKLTEQTKLLRKALFGPRRERHIPSPDQLFLFDPESLAEEEPPVAEDETCGEESSQDTSGRKKPPRKKRKKFEFPQCLPVKRIEYPLPKEEQRCPCGCGTRCVINEVVTRRLEVVPASVYVLEEVRYTYAPRCRQGEYMVTPPKPPSVNEKGAFGPSLLAYLGHMKYERHLPLYRLQEDLELMSTMWFGRSMLSGALLRTAGSLQPLWDLMHMELLDSFYLRVDETTARVLRPGMGKVGTAYLWIYVGDDEHPYNLFDFHLSRSRAGPQKILRNYRGGILSDAHSAYRALIQESAGLLLDPGVLVACATQV